MLFRSDHLPFVDSITKIFKKVNIWEIKCKHASFKKKRVIKERVEVMKLGEGKNKYKFCFQYCDTGRGSFKYVYADNIDSARKLFYEEYKDYNIIVHDEVRIN